MIAFPKKMAEKVTSAYHGKWALVATSLKKETNLEKYILSEEKPSSLIEEPDATSSGKKIIVLRL